MKTIPQLTRLTRALRLCGIFLATLAAFAFVAEPTRAAVTEAWVHRYNGPANSGDGATAVAVDASGNVAVTGGSIGNAGNSDFYTAKYAATNGALLWEARYNGPANRDDYGQALAVDSGGNVVVTGASYSTNNTADYYTAKYAAANGGLLWERRYNSPENRTDQAYAVAVDSRGNVLVAGLSGGGIFDSGDFYTAKYAASDGTLLWEKRYNGPVRGSDAAQAVALDASGNVVVTGSSDGSDLTFDDSDFYTAKYAATNGALLWEKRYNGPANSDDEGHAVAVDASGNVVVTGYSIADGTTLDYYTAKYAAANGALLWERRYNDPGNGWDIAHAVAVDGSGNIVVTGYSHNGTNYDYYTAKYAAADGAPLWEKRYNGPANGDDSLGNLQSLALGPNGTVVVTGSSDGSPSSDSAYDYATVVYREDLPLLIVCAPNAQAGTDLGLCSALIAFSIVATSTPTPVVTCTFDGSTIASPFAFPIGTNVVTCTASNIAGVTNCTFTVTVVDTAPPVITCNSNRVLECTSPTGAVATFIATATDACDANPFVVCLPASGSTFPLGTTPVTCMATDAATNRSSCTFTVTVVDTTPPTISCPAPITVNSDPGQLSARVHFAPTAADICDPSPRVACAPSPGSWFPVGRTMVWCSATDAAGNENACTFPVTVAPTPVLTLHGPDPLTNECHVPFADPGASATAGPLAVAGGFAHSLALRADGIVFAWGAATNGNTGQPYGESVVPSGLSNVVAVSGSLHSLALKSDGTVAAWGLNGHGQTSVPDGLNNAVAVAAGGLHSVALRADGTVVAWGLNDNGRTNVPPDLSNVVRIAAGGAHNLALKRDGTIAAWGYDLFGQATVPPGLSNVLDVAAGYWHSLALRRDGTVVAWGYDLYDQATVPAGLSNVVAIAAGSWHSLALTREGTVVAWGYDLYRQATVPENLSNVVVIAGGNVHSLALQNDGTIVGWGAAQNGQTTVPAGLDDLSDLVVASGVVDSEQPGTYTLHYALTDRSGNTTGTNRTVIVADTLPPLITCAADRTVECGTAWTFDLPRATDRCSGTNVRVTVATTVTNALPGNALSVTRTWLALDEQGYEADCSQTVFVVDTTPPTIGCPADITVEFSSDAGAVVPFTVETEDRCDVQVEVACVPPSGSQFAIGTTRVRCVARDCSTNTSPCSFTVTVRGARGLKENVLAELTALRAGVSRKQDVEKLDHALDHLAKSLAPELWVDPTHVQRKHGDKVFNEEKETVHKLCELAKDSQSTVPADRLADFIDRITAADRLLAVVAIQDATAGGAARKKIEEASQELAKGDSDVANPKCGDGIEHYKHAWKLATRAKLSESASLRHGRLQLEILGTAGETYVIQASTNLVDWVTVGARTADEDGVILLEDASASKVPARFYRVVSP